MKKKKSTTKGNEYVKSNVIQFSSVKKSKNGAYMIWIGKNLLFLHPNFLKSVDKKFNKAS